MTPPPLAPMAESPDFASALRAPIVIFAFGLSAAGAISLAIGAPQPHGPIAITFGMHTPLILAVWMATGRNRGPGGAAVGISLRVLWSLLLYVSICSGALLTLGVLNALTRGFAFAAVSGAGLGLMAWVLSRGSPVVDHASQIRTSSWGWCALIVIGAIAATFALLNPQYDFDMLYYHLFVPAQWAQEQRIFLVPIHFGEFAPTYYPYAAELYYLSLMLPMGSDHLARGGQIVFYLELMAAVAALGRPLRMRPLARVAATACVMLIPAFAWQAGTANVDLALTANLVAVAFFSIRLARSRCTADAAGLILAGGLAMGTKVLALPYLAALCPLWGYAALCVIRKSRSRQTAQGVGVIPVFAAGGAAAGIGGYWYVRNWLVTGNPLYPLKITLGGATLFDGVFDRAAMINSSFNQSRHGWEGLQAVLRDLLRMPAWFGAPSHWDAATTSTLGAWLILVSMPAAAILTLTRRRFHRGVALPLMFASIAAMIVLFWWSVPYQMPRFLWPPVALLVPAAFAVMSRLPRSAARGSMALFTCAWLVLSAGELFSTFVTKIAIVVAVGTLVLLWLLSRLERGRQAIVVGTCVVAIWAALWRVASAGDPPRRDNHQHARWRNFGDTWTWVDAHVDGRAIAYAGHNIPYFLMGPKLSNRVIGVQASGKPGWAYHDFARQPAARALGRPNVTDFAANRLNMDGRLWLRRLVDERVDYVVVSRLYRGPTISHRHDRDAFPIERQWLDALAQTPDGAGGRLATRGIYGGGWVLFYRLNLTEDESHWPQVSTIEQHETDALDRRRRDGTPPGQVIDGYPLAAEAIEAMRLDVLP